MRGKKKRKKTLGAKNKMPNWQRGTSEGGAVAVAGSRGRAPEGGQVAGICDATAGQFVERCFLARTAVSAAPCVGVELVSILTKGFPVLAAALGALFFCGALSLVSLVSGLSALSPLFRSLVLCLPAVSLCSLSPSAFSVSSSVFIGSLFSTLLTSFSLLSFTALQKTLSPSNSLSPRTSSQKKKKNQQQRMDAMGGGGVRWFVGVCLFSCSLSVFCPSLIIVLPLVFEFILFMFIIMVRELVMKKRKPPVHAAQDADD